MKDDSRSYAVFNEQGSSVSQMTAAKVMDVISRLPGWAGQAADAVSAYTQVKLEDPPKLLKNPKSECPDIWIRLPRHKWPKSWSSMEDPVVLLERNLYGHPLAGLLWERQFEKTLLKHGWEKKSKLGMSLRTPSKRVILICVWMTSNWLERQNIDPMWKVLNKEVDLGEPTSFLDHVYLGCTQRQCEISKDIVDNYRTMFESRISAGGVEKLPFPQNLRISSWSYDMAGHAILLYLRAIQDHSGRNLIDLSFTGQCINSERFLQVHLSHWMCNQFTLHREFRVDTRRTSFEQKTDGILHVCGSNEAGHKDPYVIDLDAPRLVWYKQKVWKKHKNTVYWVDIKLARKKGLKFYQTRSNAIILYDTLPAYCIPKAIMMETTEIIYEKVYASPRPLPKISYKKTIG